MENSNKNTKIKGVIEYLEGNHQGYYNPKTKEGKYVWRTTLDQNERILPHDKLSKVFPGENVMSFNLGVAEPIQISKDFIAQIQKGIALQNDFIQAVNKLSVIALNDLKNDYGFSTFVRNLILYGVTEESDVELITRLINVNSVKVPVLFARADVLANGKITEMQLASAGWSMAYRLYQSYQKGGEEFIKKFYNILVDSSYEKNPVIAIYVGEGVGMYWDEMADIANSINEVIGRRVAYIVGTGGLKYRNGRLVYKTSKGKKILIDIVFPLDDIRRIIAEGEQDILRAAADRAILLQPTVNPLLNNYQLSLSLLNDNLTSSWFRQHLGPTKVRKLQKACVDYFLASNSTRLKTELDGKIIELDAKNFTTNISRKNRTKYMYRKLLTHDLRELSGGWAIEKASSLETKPLRYLIAKSIASVELLKEFQQAEIEDPVISFSRYHQSRYRGKILVHKRQGSKIEKYTLTNPTMLYEVFCLNTGKGLQMGPMFAYYSDFRESGFHIGGEKRAIGLVTTQK